LPVEGIGFVTQVTIPEPRMMRYASSGRFVKPGTAAREEVPLEKPDDGKKRNNGSDGNEPPDLHPFVQGLLKELPKAGDVWPEDQRKLWLDTAASIFKMIYKDAQPKKGLLSRSLENDGSDE
jgi:hypothetical protein